MGGEEADGERVCERCGAVLSGSFRLTPELQGEEVEHLRPPDETRKVDPPQSAPAPMTRPGA